MTEYAGVVIEERPDLASGYHPDDKRLFEQFVATLPKPEEIGRLVVAHFVRNDGALRDPRRRVAVEGRQAFVDFRTMVEGTSRPHPEKPVTGFYVPPAMTEWMTGQKPGLGERR